MMEELKAKLARRSEASRSPDADVRIRHTTAGPRDILLVEAVLWRDPYHQRGPLDRPLFSISTLVFGCINADFVIYLKKRTFAA